MRPLRATPDSWKRAQVLVIATLAIAGCGEAPPERFITRWTVSAPEVAALREDERDILQLLLGHACDDVELGWRIAVRARTVPAGISDAMFEASPPTGKAVVAEHRGQEGHCVSGSPRDGADADAG
jgi:hypothetical protein